MCRRYIYCSLCGGMGGYVGADTQWHWEDGYFTVDIKCEECNGSGYVEGVEQLEMDEANEQAAI